MKHNTTLQSNKARKLTKQSIGTLNKVLEMIEENKYCPEIIQQINASIGLLNGARKQLLKGHLDHCLITNLNENKTRAVSELIKIFELSK